MLTAEGQRVATFYTKLDDRLLRPLLAANAPPAPLELRHALTTIDMSWSAVDHSSVLNAPWSPAEA